MSSLLILLIAIAFEVLGTVCMRLSEGFEVMWAAGLMLLFYGASFVSFVYCIRRIEISIAYALWTALGMLAISLVSFIFFEEAVTYPKVIALLFITAGVVGLTLESVEGS
ncbi:MAG: multidrug efflux SMR transporter [Xanthomonadaceae bacterium]|nr:multidrug efflux SMR transporter [Xanthomonadaceae bacterium]